MGSFQYISGIALAGYIIMLLILVAARKNRIVNSFMIVLTAMILWTGGSLLMRRCFWPNYVVWYHVSLLGLFLLPYGYYQFLVSYAGDQNSSAGGIYLFFTALLFGINIPNGFFLAAPEIIAQEGQITFVYNITWRVIFLFVGGAAGVGHIIMTVHRICKENREVLKRFLPVLQGIIVMFAGHVALMFPVFAGFPVDILSGLINAVIIMYALVKRRLFRLRMIASERVCYAIGLLLNLLIYFNFEPYISQLLNDSFHVSERYDSVIFIACFVVTTVLVTMAWYIIIKKLFSKGEMLEDIETDELTKLLNRKSFYKYLDEEMQKMPEGPLALVLLSIDDFKLYNQIYGAQEGDKALQTIAGIIQKNIGKDAYAARYTGRQFALLLPGCSMQDAEKVTLLLQDKIRSINDERQEDSLKLLTVSAGISAVPETAKTGKELLETADFVIHHVKRNSRNAIRKFDWKDREKEIAVAEQPTDRHQIYQEYENTIRALTEAIHTKDHYTFQHSENVAYYATELAKAVNLNDDVIEIVRQAALLHDVGKIGIPEAILNKPGKLSEEEYDAIKGHVGASIGIIRHLPSLDYVIPAVISHHERYDGGGYPRGISGETIPYPGRILSVADAFDAMISDRCYRSGMETEVVLEILRIEEGKQFDPQLAHIFADGIRNGKIKVRKNE